MNAKALLAVACAALAGCAPIEAQRDPPQWRVAAEATIGGMAFPESVGCDPGEWVVYVSQFGGTELKPAEKDGKGFISKLAPDGRILEAKVFDVTMNKPKGIWVARGRLWVTDIDGVWIFDTRSKKGRKVMIPGAQFANDPAVRGDVLYVSDNRSDQLFRIHPADFLDANVQPTVSVVLSKPDINPNGLWPTAGGSLYMVGFLADDKPKGVFAMGKDGEVKAMGAALGRLDGIGQMRDGTFLVSDWKSGTLNTWREASGLTPIAGGFKGPADFCVLGNTVYVPDLVKSELRIMRLTR
jgi:hypothetical protein